MLQTKKMEKKTKKKDKGKKKSTEVKEKLVHACACMSVCVCVTNKKSYWLKTSGTHNKYKKSKIVQEIKAHKRLKMNDVLYV